jgi:poly(3-hydroxybutyrate) depolymerase
MKAHFSILLSIASLATATASAGCGKPLPEHQGAGGHYPTDFTTSDGTLRSYIIHIPSNYDENRAVPLIFSFHGRSKTAESQEQLSQFSNEAWNPDAIAVYPQGLDVRASNSPYVVVNQCTHRTNGKETQLLLESTTWHSPWKCSTTSRKDTASILLASMPPVNQTAGASQIS